MHVLFVHISDLPKNTIKPNLQINKIKPKPIEDLSAGHKNNILEGLQQYSHQDLFQVVAYHLVYTTERIDGPFLRPIVVDYQGNP
jgi:hypothetical protein